MHRYAALVSEAPGKQSWLGLSQSGDVLVFGRLRLAHLIHAVQHFVGHRVIDAIVAVLDVLLGQGACRGHLMPVGALCSSLALTPHEETAHWRLVPLQSSSTCVKTFGMR